MINKLIKNVTVSNVINCLKIYWSIFLNIDVYLRRCLTENTSSYQSLCYLIGLFLTEQYLYYFEGKFFGAARSFAGYHIL